jgi:hypothetical protein
VVTSRARRAFTLLLALTSVLTIGLTAAVTIPSPEQFIGFRAGADNKLARWDTVLEYMKAVAASSDRVRLHELGKTSGGNAFVFLEIASPATLRAVDQYKKLERTLYFQDGIPTTRERDDLFRRGKIVILVTMSVHADEVGATQMSMALVHQLATDDSPAVRKILDNVIFLVVPCANPDGQELITDWFNKNLGTPFEASPLPWLPHPYAGHDINRDMYMFTQKESQYLAQLMWHDWFPTIWLDEHQMGRSGPRIFVMPASDPINQNVHPLIYRLNGILGQSQAAALEAAGKDGIIYDSTYTNFWEGAMAWCGWWHNEIGLLTEVASARIAAPVEQQRANAKPSTADSRFAAGTAFDTGILPPPTDTTPRTSYPRPWLGGRWTLGDIVEYEQIATMALLETAADRRETLLRQIFEVNRETVEAGHQGDTGAIVVPLDGQQDVREAAHLVDRLQIGGVEVYRAETPFDAEGKSYRAGSFVIPMNQVFARYAKDLLEPQNYPEVKSSADGSADAPYDVTAWSLGMLLGVNVEFLKSPVSPSVRLTRLREASRVAGQVAGAGDQFGFRYAGPDTATAINRLLKSGAHVAFDAPSHATVTAASRGAVETIAKEFGLSVTASSEPPTSSNAQKPPIVLHAPRVGVYQPWTSGNIDEGWTRWVLEQYGFDVMPLANGDIRDRGLRERLDAVIIPDQNPREILDGFNVPYVRPEFRGGIGEAGVESLRKFVADGGTLVAFGAATDLVIDRWLIPVRNVKRTLRREQHYGPGTILRLDVNTSSPLGYGAAPETFGFYNDSPFFATIDTAPLDRVSIVARYPLHDVVASGWLKGEEAMAGRAAVVSVDMTPGRLVLFGLRPQHRGQTHATFPLLFDALYMSAAEGTTARLTQ